MKRSLSHGQIIVLAILFISLLAGTLYGCASTQQEPVNSPAQEQQAEQQETSTSEVTPTDYSDGNNWLSKPDALVHEADVLYFYPTCYMPESDDDPRICGIDNAVMRAGAQVKLLDQASAFTESADLYAPYYRQVDAMSLAGLSQEEMLEVESAEPKHDVFASLDYYFEHYNQGRPFVLAGHSQGAMMVQLILDEYLEEHPALSGQMVAAYMIGNAATESWLALNPHVTMAQGADDTGVLVSWNTEGPGNRDQYNMVAPAGSVCINPLNWKTDTTPAGVEENLGTLIQDDEGNLVVVEGVANAVIDKERGTVISTNVDPDMYAVPLVMKDLFGTQSYHSWDIKFYYENIRQNVADRIAAYLSESSES